MFLNYVVSSESLLFYGLGTVCWYTKGAKSIYFVLCQSQDKMLYLRFTVDDSHLSSFLKFVVLVGCLVVVLVDKHHDVGTIHPS